MSQRGGNRGGSRGCEPLSVLAAASEMGSSPALIVGDEEWSWSELAERVRSFGRWLEDGLQPAGAVTLPPPVAVTGCNRCEQVVACYALIEMAVPFALLHPRWTESERERVGAEVGSPLEITAEFALPPAEAPRGSASTLASSLAKAARADPGRPLAVIFTSGTCGRPKGAVLSRRAFLCSAAASAKNLGRHPDERWLLSLPIAHVGGLSILTRSLIGRGCMVLSERVLSESGSFRAEGFLETLHRARVTVASLVPTQLHRLLQLGPPARPPESLRALLVGGARASQSLLAAARAQGWPVLATYGLTEACSQVATQPPGLEAAEAASAGVGPALPGVELRLRESGERSEGGFAIGEIELRGPMMFDGYLEQTASPSDAASPFDPGGWFATGDVGYLDERGRLHLLDRRSDLIVSGGENVYPGEVEAALEEHPAVVRACVFALADEEWGERVAAALEGERCGLDELRRHLESRLATFKRPRLGVWLEQLPVSASGKLDREACRKEALAAGLDPWGLARRGQVAPGGNSPGEESV